MRGLNLFFPDLQTENSSLTVPTQEDAWPQQPHALPYPQSHPDPEHFPNGVVRFAQVQVETLHEEHMRQSSISCSIYPRRCLYESHSPGHCFFLRAGGGILDTGWDSQTALICLTTLGLTFLKTL
jgi:hypothetical protein